VIEFMTPVTPDDPFTVVASSAPPNARPHIASGIAQAKSLRSTGSGLAIVNNFGVDDLRRPACVGTRLLLRGAGPGLLERGRSAT